uniref:Alternative protein KCNS3 n=1 Tax=Homo sapiens TaxID=9606 RepID=L8E8W4_HUMAN|nr:alternative protein KCNS3 [Homo sapiens]
MMMDVPPGRMKAERVASPPQGCSLIFLFSLASQHSAFCIHHGVW